MASLSDARIQPEALTETVAGLLDEYGQDVMSGVRTAVDATMREMVQETKRTAPRRTLGGRPAGTFASHISSKVTSNGRFAYAKTWYVRSPEHGLAHLLNNGHALRQGGRWGGVPFITDAANTGADRFESRVKEAVRDASG